MAAIEIALIAEPSDVATSGCWAMIEYEVFFRELDGGGLSVWGKFLGWVH